MPGGRPRKVIDWEKFRKLCQIHCTLEEIVNILDISERTIEMACKREHKLSFCDLHKRWAADGKMSIRRKQIELALAGNPTMLIWCGKQLLGQKDRTELSGDANAPVKVIVEYGE